MRLVYRKTIGGTERLIQGTTPTGDQGAFVKAAVGVGNAFWAWNAIPAGKVIMADFTDAPICTNDTVENNALIEGIAVEPLDVLTYQ